MVSDEQIIDLIQECNEARCDYSDVEKERGWAGYHGGRPGYCEDDDRENPRGHWALRVDLQDKLKMGQEEFLSRMVPLIDSGKVNGCACGCRGDFSVTSLWDGKL